MNQLLHFPIAASLGVLFLLVFPIAVFMVARLAKRGAPDAMTERVFWSVLVFYGLYLGWTAVAAGLGWFDVVAFPPRVLLLTTFPLAAFLFIFVIKWRIFDQILQKLRLDELVAVHIFRLIGAFFLIFAFEGWLPRFFGLIAGFGDVLTAISSIFIARALRQNQPNALRWTRFWNIFGFVDIVFTAVSALVLTKLSIQNGTLGVDALAQFPFCFIPAFAPPTIIFLHVAVFKKLRAMAHLSSPSASFLSKNNS